MSAIEAEVTRQRRYGGLFSLAELDLDGFKTLNDTRGHPAGDDVLKLLAEILRRHTRKSDLAGRLGGDEFPILMPNMGEADCMQFLQHLCSTIETGMVEAGFEITASIGFKTFLRAPESISQALLQVDQSMYQAKRAGKGRVARIAEAPNK
jgi:diguanylate cyclase (GGDEF)-like protein